jgi:hypothetical protein
MSVHAPFRIIEISNTLRNWHAQFYSAAQGEKLRRELERLTKETYQQKYGQADYFDFIRRYGEGLSIDRCGDQDSNNPYEWEMFTVRTQHVYGNSMEQLFDNALSKTKRYRRENTV